MPNLVKIRTIAYTNQQGQCYYCRMPMWTGSIDKFANTHHLTSKQARLFQCTAEHLVARCDGGNNVLENIVAACHYCNLHRHARKHPLPPNEYSQFVRKRLNRGKWHLAKLCKEITSGSFVT